MVTMASKPYSILITDDDRNCREVIRRIVEPEGFHALEAESGEEALDVIQDTQVHLALFDMHMPRMTGLETVQLVHQFNAVLPCILVTADASEVLIREALRARAYSVIHKPVSKDLLLYIVVRALVRAYGGSQGEQAE
jgi:CheY-like chemotaxis protein